MQSALIVGLGGFAGSILRYGLGRIPIMIHFPLMTMLINVLGSFIIGIVWEFSKDRAAMLPNAALFLQTGLCGGFTTFSAFSLETVILFQNKKCIIGASYVILTVILCIGCTIFGMLLTRIIKAKLMI